jgi:cob(I)alamin adenosyltransferase
MTILEIAGDMQETDVRAFTLPRVLTTGYVQVYTGNGKGKTTAAIGLAIRAVGAGFRVLIVQFLKNGNYSEIKTLGRLSRLITLEQYGAKRIIGQSPTEIDRILFRKGLERVKATLDTGKYQMVVMDEANVAVHYGLLSVEDLLGIITSKPRDVELIITGRYAHPNVVAAADLVTEMKEVKHYYRKGVPGRLGIEK